MLIFFPELIIVERFIYIYDVPLDEINELKIKDETKNIK
jgi:hypothetical protein